MSTTVVVRVALVGRLGAPEQGAVLDPERDHLTLPLLAAHRVLLEHPASMRYEYEYEHCCCALHHRIASTTSPAAFPEYWSNKTGPMEETSYNLSIGKFIQ